MKLKNVVIIIFFGTVIVSCKKEKLLQDYMVDSWQTTYLKIEMPTYEKSDSLEIYEDKFENSPELIAQSTYKKDGTFSAWFLNKKGEKISNSEGKWSAQNDSLNVEFFYNGKSMQVSYHITKTAEGFLGKSLYDWDNDGEFDDLLTMKTKRINTD